MSHDNGNDVKNPTVDEIKSGGRMSGSPSLEVSHNYNFIKKANQTKDLFLPFNSGSQDRKSFSQKINKKFDKVLPFSPEEKMRLYDKESPSKTSNLFRD